MIVLKKIDRDNLEECIRLKVREDQKKFVALNMYSLAEAYAKEELVPLAIYDGETMVGFVMYYLDRDSGEYWICRLMVDEKHQGKGYGRQAMEEVISRVQADKDRHALFISFEPDNHVAEKLYGKLGFVRTGEILEGEAVMRLDY